MPKLNLHTVNDFLNQHPDLDPYEFRIAYYTVHADYGRRKNGLFWEGALSIESKIGIGRRVIQKCWKKMQAKGWLIDTGKKKGRATIWRINYDQLMKEAEEFKEARMKGDETRSRNVMRLESKSNATLKPTYCDSGYQSNATRDATTSPNYSSKKTPPKDYPHTSSEDYDWMIKQMEQDWMNQPGVKRFDTKNVSK